MIIKKATINELLSVYKGMSSGVKNKKRIYDFECHKMEYLYLARDMINNLEYTGGVYNIFLIKYPKKRIIMSQTIFDKLINHYVTKNILEPKLSNYLDKRCTATRKNMGQSYAIRLFKEYINKEKFKYENLYILKLDIKNYFPSIDHSILKEMLKSTLDDEEMIILNKIIDSTDKLYVNKEIKNINNKYSINMPLYENKKGLPIGNMTSQFLAIYYLHKLNHFIINDLKIKTFVNYMDDYVLIHFSKKYLKECMSRIIKFLKRYDLEINQNKTYIVLLRKGVSFLGYHFIMNNNKKLIINLLNSTKKNMIHNIKKEMYFSQKNNNYQKLFNTLSVYKNSFIFVNNYKIKNIIEKYW